jgi:hypothetical protein
MSAGCRVVDTSDRARFSHTGQLGERYPESETSCNMTDLGGKVVAFRRQTEYVSQRDTWPIGFLYLYVSARSIGR